MIVTKPPSILVPITAVLGCDFAFITKSADAVSIKISGNKNFSFRKVQELEKRYQKSFEYKVLDKLEKN